MRSNRAITARRRNLATCILLGLLLLRAYVPVGFMPASGAPFMVELCSAAGDMPMETGMDSRMDMATAMAMDPDMDMSKPMDSSMGMHPGSHRHTHADPCPFGSAPAAAPLSHEVTFQVAASSPPFASADFQSAPPGQRLQRAHAPRGPPSLA